MKSQIPENTLYHAHEYFSKNKIIKTIKIQNKKFLFNQIIL